MRNIKRVLSLALASVMLLGMMVVGSSAAFNDADKIVNTKAATVTAGLGLFAGTTDGNFDPTGTVTRAQMAAVISKMVYGSEVNADSFKGQGKFSDTASFEGGWAEGYINLCVNLGVVSGYGDGTFRPGNAVTTAEAVTMLINALGVDAGEGQWPMTVMAAAETIELFNLEEKLSPKPATNAALTRDELSVMVLNALYFSPDGGNVYMVGDKKFDDATAAYLAAGFNPDLVDVLPAQDTLATETFGITTATGYVTANQATGEDYTVVAGKNINLETGLDMLGHFVTVYYKEEWKSESKPGVAYCIAEEAEYVTVTEAFEASTKDYKAAFGAKVKVTLDESEDVDVDCMSFNNDGLSVPEFVYNETAGTAAAGTYVISNETGKIIAFIEPVATTVDVVNRVTTTAGKESIKLSTTLLKNTEDEDEVVEYDGIAEDDIVIVKNILGVTILEKPEVVSGKITKTGTVDKKAATYIDGKAYVNGTWDLTNTELTGVAFEGEEIVFTYAPDANKTYDAYLYNGKLIGVKQTAGTINLNEVIYIVDNYETVLAGNYGSDKAAYYAQGVDAAGKEVSILIGIEDCTEGEGGLDVIDALETNTFYVFEKVTSSEDKEQAKKGIMKATAALALEDYEVDVDEFFAETVTGTDKEEGALKKDDRFVVIGEDEDAQRVYLTAETKFVVVEQNVSTDELQVATYTGNIAKDLGEHDVVTVAAVEDENGNYLAQVIVISAAELSLKAEEYIYISAAAEADASIVEGGLEVNAYFSATNEFKAIVADIADAGFYSNYKIDEEGVYELTGHDTADFIEAEQEMSGIFGNAVSTLSGDIDLYNAANAVVVDVRAEDVLEESEVAEIASLKDIQSAMKAEYKVLFDAIVDTEGVEDVVTHIFVYSVLVEEIGEDGEPTGDWVEA